MVKAVGNLVPHPPATGAPHPTSETRRFPQAARALAALHHEGKSLGRDNQGNRRPAASGRFSKCGLVTA